MNLNVKLEGEEEQTIQYVNRFAINIPSTAFNLNIVNSGLNNQGYILNPVNSVGQNIVTYQPPVALQSYFTLPVESEGNILHSLPVGVPVPVGLPVQTGFLQNNFVNTSIIIGNENCNSQGVLDSSQNHIDQADDSKSNFLAKPLEELVVNTSDTQNMGLNCSPHLNLENVGKKPCPLEMSIKAANIDIEFEKCEMEIPVLVENSLGINEVRLNENLLNSGDNGLKIDLNEPVVLEQNQIPGEECNLKKLKTEIMWDNNTVKNSLGNNNFQESLICEVEEVNDDEGEDESYDGTFTSKNEICSDKRDERDTSSEESDGLPLSIALKIKKIPDSKCTDNKCSKKGKSDNVRNKKKVEPKGKKHRKVDDVADSDLSDSDDDDDDSDDDEDEDNDDDDDEEWSESDDDVLNLKRIKNEFSYKCFFEPKTTKQILKVDDKSKIFMRVRSCCSKKECSKKISVRDQMTAHKYFYELESNSKRDLYLMNCIEHVQKTKNHGKDAKEKNQNSFEKLGEADNLAVNPNIQLEIENESNGNQKLSDEIQNAINESLKDCGVQLDNSGKINRPELAEEPPSSDKEEKNNWNYFIVIDKSKKKVCLQFLLKLLRITKNRIKQLQKKILSGTPLVEETYVDDVWETAKLHLESLPGEESFSCEASPRHRFFSTNHTKEELFEKFKAFYRDKHGKDPVLKFPAYKRFLDKGTSVSFLQLADDTCAECEDLKRRRKVNNKNVKESGRLQKTWSDDKKKRNDHEDSISDGEPSANCKRIKLTIPLKGISNSHKMTQKENKRKQNFKSKSSGDKKTKASKEKNKHSTSRGRDVWSLMLLHLETMPYKECKSCNNKKKHRFLSSTFTTQGLFEDYRKYFLKETNSELGLGFTMYEKYFNRNCNYTIMDLNANETRCPRCVSDQLRS